MLKVEIKFKEAESTDDTCKAYDVLEGDMFVDCDGDVYLKTVDGCIMFENNCLTPYSNEEMQDLAMYPWMQSVGVIEGSIKVKVKV